VCVCGLPYTAGARLTKYLTTILRLSYDNAKVTIDLRRTSSLRYAIRRTQGFSQSRLGCKIARSPETERNRRTSQVTVVSRSYDNATINRATIFCEAGRWSTAASVTGSVADSPGGSTGRQAGGGEVCRVRERDGFSLRTLYRNSSAHACWPVLLIIHDQRTHVRTSTSTTHTHKVNSALHPSGVA